MTTPTPSEPLELRGSAENSMAMPSARAAHEPNPQAVSAVPVGVPIADADAAELHDRRLQALAQLMSGISEDCWCAGWIIGNEFALYRMAFQGGPRRYGMSEVGLDDVEELRRLARLTGSWWQWGDDGEEVVALEAFAQGMETRQGGDGTAPLRSNDSPVGETDAPNTQGKENNNDQ